MTRPTTRRVRLGLEVMEDRRLPAATLTAALGVDGILRVEGTDGPDSFDVRSCANGNVYVGNLSQNFPTAQVRAIEVDLLGGDDRLWLNAESVGYLPLTRPTVVRG